MSVLKSIKGLQHDLAAGFKSLTTGTVSVKNNPETASEGGHSKQLGAGAELLNKFQTQWSMLHREAEENASIAEGVDQQVTNLYLWLEQQNNGMTQLVTELTRMPQLLHDIQLSMDMIGEIEVHCSELDTVFEDLQDVYRECELRSKKQHHQYQLTLYEQRRALELEQIKVQLAKKHARSVECYEARLQAILQEKQQAYADASKLEMEHYRIHGHTQLKRSISPESLVELADISLDQDQAVLDAFLQADTDAGKNDMPNAGLAHPTTASGTQNDTTQQDAEEPTDDMDQSDMVKETNTDQFETVKETNMDVSDTVKETDTPKSKPEAEDQHLSDGVKMA